MRLLAFYSTLLALSLSVLVNVDASQADVFYRRNDGPNQGTEQAFGVSEEGLPVAGIETHRGSGDPGRFRNFIGESTFGGPQNYEYSQGQSDVDASEEESLYNRRVYMLSMGGGQEQGIRRRRASEGIYGINQNFADAQGIAATSDGAAAAAAGAQSSSSGGLYTGPDELSVHAKDIPISPYRLLPHYHAYPSYYVYEDPYIYGIVFLHPGDHIHGIHPGYGFAGASGAAVAQGSGLAGASAAAQNTQGYIGHPYYGFQGVYGPALAAHKYGVHGYLGHPSYGLTGASAAAAAEGLGIHGYLGQPGYGHLGASAAAAAEGLGTHGYLGQPGYGYLGGASAAAAAEGLGSHGYLGQPGYGHLGASGAAGAQILGGRGYLGHPSYGLQGASAAAAAESSGTHGYLGYPGYGHLGASGAAAAQSLGTHGYLDGSAAAAAQSGGVQGYVGQPGYALQVGNALVDAKAYGINRNYEASKFFAGASGTVGSRGARFMKMYGGAQGYKGLSSYEQARADALAYGLKQDYETKKIIGGASGVAGASSSGLMKRSVDGEGYAVPQSYGFQDAVAAAGAQSSRLMKRSADAHQSYRGERSSGLQVGQAGADAQAYGINRNYESAKIIAGSSGTADPRSPKFIKRSVDGEGYAGLRSYGLQGNAQSENNPVNVLTNFG